MQNRERIRQASHRLRRRLLIVACAMPVINALAWISINHRPSNVQCFKKLSRVLMI